MDLEGTSIWVLQHPGMLFILVAIFFFFLYVTGGISGRICIKVDEKGQSRALKLAVACFLIGVLIIFWPKPEETIMISGSVYSAQNYKPLKNVNVEIVGLSDKAVRTDSNGLFNITNVPKGKANYLLVKTDISKMIDKIEIPENEKNQTTIFIQIPIKPTTITLSGDVYNEYGETVNHAKIWINTLQRNVTADELGRYTAEVYSNVTSIKVYDGSDLERYMNNTFGFTEQEIKDGEKIFDINLPSKSTINIYGKVYDARKKIPIINASVEIGNVSNRTNDNGFYEIPYVPREAKNSRVTSPVGTIYQNDFIREKDVNLTQMPWKLYRDWDCEIRILSTAMLFSFVLS
jgi:hypothetical protein